MSKTDRLFFEPSLFTPAEVARISGLSQGMQRDWRSRGYLPKSEKHARFDALAVAKLLVMQKLADRTIGPLESRAVAAQCAAAVVSQALIWMPEAWSADPVGIFDNLDPEEQHYAALEYHPPLDHLYGWNKDEEKDQRSAIRFISENEKRDWIFRSFTHGANAHWRLSQSPDELIWWCNGDVQFGDYGSIRESMSPEDPRIEGAAVILPIDGLAMLMVRRAGKPLLNIKHEVAP